MTPREALYNLVVALGPLPSTKRDENLSLDEIKIRDSVETLKELILEHESREVQVDNSDQLRLPF